MEIDGAIMESGSVHPVKIFGVMALLDEGETDWKLIVISIADPLAAKLNDSRDVEEHGQGLIEAARNWFRHYDHGVVLFYLVTEGYPFEGETVYLVFKAIEEEPVRISDSIQKPLLRDLLARMLEKDPERKISARDALQHS